MTAYRPPKGFFDPLELTLVERALEGAWSEIRNSNLIELEKDDALKRAICLKLLSLIRTRPTDADSLRQVLLSALSPEPQSASTPATEHLS
jgi:hypothetical protein